MSKEQILALVAANTLTIDEAIKLLKELEPVAVARPVGELYCKVGGKGTCSVYGLTSKFPVALYVDQWSRLKEFITSGKLDAFLEANEDSLERKSDGDEVKLRKSKTPARLAAAAKSAEYAKTAKA